MDKVKFLEQQVAELTARLDKELDWTETKEAGTVLCQAAYRRRSILSEKLSDYEAKQLIYRFFGFDPDLVEIIKEVVEYEVNKYGDMRAKEKISDRYPLYISDEDNYVCFECRGHKYECVCGKLFKYEKIKREYEGLI